MIYSYPKIGGHYSVSANGANPDIIINEAGVYLVKLSLSNDCSSQDFYGAITVYPDIETNFNAQIPQCINSSDALFNANLTTSPLNISCTSTTACLQQKNLDSTQYKVRFDWEFKTLNVSRTYTLDQVLSNSDDNENVNSSQYINTDVKLTTTLIKKTRMKGEIVLGSKTYHQFMENTGPTAPKIIGPGEACLNDTLQFIIDTTLVNHTYLWDFNNGQTSYSPTSFVFYNNTGDYVIALTIIDTLTQCQFMSNKTITILDCSTVDTITVPDSLRNFVLKAPASSPTSQMTVKVYPNPSNGQFTIEIVSSAETMQKVNVYNTFGQVVESFSNINTNLFRIRMQQPAGIYYLETITDRDRVLKKILINTE